MDDARKFDDLVQFRAPPNLSKAIEAAAKQRCQSKSDYIRQSIVDRLRSDGIHVRGIAGRACVLLVCALVASSAMAAGTLPGISMTQQFDALGKPLGGGQLFLIQAGTVGTPQNCFQDSGLTIAWPNPITLDSAGRIPQLFCADGSIKVRLTNKNGVQQLVVDGLLVVGPSGGGGGGSTVDPSTVFQTGAFMQFYGTSILSGWVRCNGRTIGSATSGATERANSDTQALFAYLWTADSNLAVSGGRGASAAADFGANKTLTVPDCRGRVLAGLDDMGNSLAGRLTPSYFGTTATTLGATGGAERESLAPSQVPTITSSNALQSITVNAGGNIPISNGGWSGAAIGSGPNTGPFTSGSVGNQSAAISGTNNVTVTSNNTGGATPTPFITVQPTILATTYLKL